MEEIQVIKTAFSFLFKLFQLLFWLDFEPVNEKNRRGSTEKGGREEVRELSNLRLQDTGSTCMSREQL